VSRNLGRPKSHAYRLVGVVGRRCGLALVGQKKRLIHCMRPEALTRPSRSAGPSWPPGRRR
jgi:hypothetical protein